MKKLAVVLLLHAACQLNGVAGSEADSAAESLVDAIMRNDPVAAREALQSSGDVNRRIFGATPLHLAAEYGRTEIVELLLQRNAAVDAHDDLGKTPLLWAAENGHAEVARALIAHGANLDEEDISGFRGPLDESPADTPLDFAIRSRNIELCRMLLEAGAAVKKHDYRRLENAIASGESEILALLLDRGIEATAHAKGDNAFADAGATRHVEMLKLLVSRSSPSPLRRTFLNDALQNAAEYGRLPTIRYLLDETDVDLNREVSSSYGGEESIPADPKKKLPGYTALSRAIEQGYDDIARALIERGARIAGRTRSGAPLLNFLIGAKRDDFFYFLLNHRAPIEGTDIDGRTALMVAALNGRLEFTRTLVEKGAKIEARDTNESTALMLACQEGALPVAQYLVTAGARLTARDREGRDPLIHAAANGRAEVCAFLVVKGADPNKAQPKTGMTALHWAARKAHPLVVRQLLDDGASPQTTDQAGKKPIDYARLAGDAESIRLLTTKQSTPGN